MELTSRKPNYRPRRGSPLSCRSHNWQARIYIFSFFVWIDFVHIHICFPIRTSWQYFRKGLLSNPRISSWVYEYEQYTFLPKRTRFGQVCPAQEKKFVKRTYKVCNYWTVLATKSQEAAEAVKTKKKSNDPLGFIVSHTQCLSFSALKINKSFLIFIKAKYFFNIVSPLLTKSRDCKLSWPSLFGRGGWILASFFFCVFKCKNRTRPISSHPDFTLGQ